MTLKFKVWFLKAVRDAENVEVFMQKLEEEDASFERWRSTAAAEGKVLRHIATLADGKGKVGVQACVEFTSFLFG